MTARRGALGLVALATLLVASPAPALGARRASLHIEKAHYEKRTGKVSFLLTGYGTPGGVLSAFLSTAPCTRTFNQEDAAHGADREQDDVLLGRRAAFRYRRSYYAVPGKQNYVCEYLTQNGIATLAHAAARVPVTQAP